MLIKNEITCRNRLKVLDAIFDYTEPPRPLEEYIRLTSNLESYSATLWRLWDFGCENILPKADYELIKPYVKRGRR